MGSIVTAKTNAINKKLPFTDTFMCLGAVIIFLGIAILLYQNWSMLGFLTKMIATLGFGIASYITAVLLLGNKQLTNISCVFFVVFALTTPIGLKIGLAQYAGEVGKSTSFSLISVVMLSSCLLSYFYLRHSLFVLLSALFASWFVINITDVIIGDPVSTRIHEFYKYRLLLLGVSYIALGYAFSKNKKHWIPGCLYFMGSVTVLTIALALGGWRPDQNIFWDMAYPVLILMFLRLSFYIKSKSFMLSGIFFLAIYIIKITVEYFSKSLGWPICLMIIGSSMIIFTYILWYLKYQKLSLK